MHDVDPHALLSQHGEEVLDRYRHACQPYCSALVWATLCLKYRHGKTVAEIAQIMGRAQSTICSRLTRAQKLLKQHESALRREAYEVRRSSVED